jgi:phosphatidylinositol dimannoside acyltransferase
VKFAARIGRELRATFELWLVPFAVAILPYRAGILLARVMARVVPIYALATNDAARAFGAVVGGAQPHEWRCEYRFQQLIDHADLFWTLTRSRAFLDRWLRGAPALPAVGRPLIVLSFHYGQGMWLMRWLAAGGRPPRFVSIRPTRELTDSAVAYAYARLRNRTVEALTGRSLIFTGGARREIASALREGTTVFGLVDVPLADSSAHAPNATLLGHPVVLPSGLLESAIPGTRALIVTARVGDDGMRQMEASEVDAQSLTVGDLADELSKRLAHAPAAWHFWHLWPRFLAREPVTDRRSPIS